MRWAETVYAGRLKQHCMWQSQNRGMQGGTKTDSPCVKKKRLFPGQLLLKTPCPRLVPRQYQASPGPSLSLLTCFLLPLFALPFSCSFTCRSNLLERKAFFTLPLEIYEKALRNWIHLIRPYLDSTFSLSLSVCLRLTETHFLTRAHTHTHT